MAGREQAVGIARVSSKGQEEEGYSLDSQEKLMHNYCDSHALSLIKVFKIAESASKAERRRIFREAMKFVEGCGIKSLIVEKVDRHARNFHDAVETHDWLMADAERRIHFIKDSLVLHQNARSQEWLNWGIRVVMAKNYIDNLREESMKGWAEKLAQGWLPGVPPLGYKTVSRDGKKIHIPDLATSHIMADIFELYLHPSQSLASIAEELRSRGVRTRKGRPYGKSQMQNILQNPFYIGVNRFDGKDYPGRQETFITKELFEKVQAKMHGKRPAVLRKHNPLFKNLITCENCAGVVTWQLQKGRYYGRCQRLKPACKDAKTVREDRIEAQIVAMLKDLVCPSPEIIEWVNNELRKRRVDQSAVREETLKALEAQIDRIARMDGELYDDKLAGDISRETYDAKHRNFMEQKAEMETKRDKVAARNSSDLEQRLALLNLSQKAAEIYKTRTVEQKRLIIIKLFSSITFNNDSVSVAYTNFVKVIANKTLKTREILGR
ncbi:MAG TPA: recombinase family protein [Candidatus Saccharimonadales bacterium]|nr:recombinase family protein [Candidatus Saccharimonadales bacterium]